MTPINDRRAKCTASKPLEATRWLVVIVASLLPLGTALGKSHELAPPVGEIETAVDVLAGRSSRYSYEEAIDIISRSADARNVMGLRAEAALWITAFPNPSHRTSWVNAYFSFKRNRILLPADDWAGLLIDARDPMFEALNGAMGYGYKESVDPINDARNCSVTGPDDNAVSFGFDSTGGYVTSNGLPLDYKSFERFALRAGHNTAHIGLKPAAVASVEEVLESAKWLYTHGELSLDDFQKFTREQWAAVSAPTKIYVAEENTQEFERLLREVALADEITVRVRLSNKSERVAVFPVSAEASKTGKKVNIFDYLGYRYVNCLYGRID